MAYCIVMLTVVEWPSTQKVYLRVRLNKISTETKYSKRCERIITIHPLGHGLYNILEIIRAAYTSAKHQQWLTRPYDSCRSYLHENRDIPWHEEVSVTTWKSSVERRPSSSTSSACT